MADTSLTGMLVARARAKLIEIRGKPRTVVSDNDTELTSSAILRWAQERQVEWRLRRSGQADAERLRRELLRFAQHLP